MIVGNKTDLANERQVQREQGLNYVSEYANQNIMFFETSAKDSTNVEEAFTHLAQRAMMVHDEREGTKEANKPRETREETK